MLDEEIVKLFFERREEAIRRAEQQYGRYVKTVAGQFLCDEEDVKECASDVWLDAWNTIPPQKPTNLKAYLAVLCRRISIDRIRRDLRKDCIKLEKITVSEKNEHCRAVDNCLIHDGTLIKGCSGSVIPENEGITGIENYAFKDCTGLKNLIIPEGVVRIGYGAFENCRDIERIVLPESIEEIGRNAFWCDPFYERSSIRTVVINATFLRFASGTGLFSSGKVEDVFFAGTEEQWKELPFVKNGEFESSTDGRVKIWLNGTRPVRAD